MRRDGSNKRREEKKADAMEDGEKEERCPVKAVRKPFLFYLLSLPTFGLVSSAKKGEGRGRRNAQFNPILSKKAPNDVP